MNLQSLILELVSSLACNHRKKQTFYCFIKFQFKEYERLLKKVDRKLPGKEPWKSDKPEKTEIDVPGGCV